MELQYYGANCLRIITKNKTLVVDDNLADVGLKTVTKTDDVCLRTSDRTQVASADFVIDMPGEYEIGGVTIHGIAARNHMDDETKLTAVIYTVAAGDAKIAILGHIFPELSDNQVEEIGRVDAVVVPVGNSGYTMDGIGALKVIKKIEPRVVIPTHYADKAVKYEVPQVDLADALKGLAMEPAETVDKFKVAGGEFSDTTRLVVLNRQ